MKEYVKPTLEIVELRLEERVACCSEPNDRRGHSNPGGHKHNRECSHSSS